MTQYDETIHRRCASSTSPSSLKNTLGEYLAANGKTQLRIAETQKYAHVTFFFNGGVEAPQRGRGPLPDPVEQGCRRSTSSPK